MDVISGLLQFLSAGSIGLYAGAMLTEGFILVPIWRSAAPAEFYSWYAANGGRLQGFFGPITWAAGLLAIAAALVASWVGQPGRWTAVAAAALMAVAASSFFVYFKRANESFARGGSSEADLPAELTRWASWHRSRTAVSLGALAAALLSLARIG